MLFARLKEEREKQGLTQPQLGAICDTKKNTVINWEKGASSPNGTQFEAMAKVGMDITYIITGVPSTPGIPQSLPPDEQLLLDTYRGLPVPQRKEMLATLLTGGKPVKKKTPVKHKGDFGISGEGNTVTVGGGVTQVKMTPDGKVLSSKKIK